VKAENPAFPILPVHGIARLEHDAHDRAQALAQQYTPKSVSTHIRIIELCIDGVCWYIDVRHIEESMRVISPGIGTWPPAIRATSAAVYSFDKAL
jgi:hypothetical protein